MSPKVWICEHGQVHKKTRGNANLRLVMPLVCTAPNKHKAIAAAVASQEIDHEVKVETLLYSLDALTAKYDMEPELIVDLTNLTKNLREVLDHEAPI
jgi:hypothetical protein